MATELSTIGVRVKWAVETTAGTMPTTGFTALPEIKSIPALGGSPSPLETTALEDANHVFIPGLPDLDGVVGFTVNDCPTFREAWTEMLEAYDTAKASGKALWIEYYIPDFKFKLTSASQTATQNSFYYPAIPSVLNFGGAEVNGVLETTAYVTINGTISVAVSST